MAINFSSFLVSSLITFLVIIYSSLAHQQGFTTDLIHRDSPLSPLYNSSLDKYERLSNAIQRSMSKVNRFKTSPLSGYVQSQVKYARGEYFMGLSFGTPPVFQLGIVDTGSDLIWTQCKPCTQCYKQILPVFDPRKSSTYKVQSCDTQACLDLEGSQHSCYLDKFCYYSYQYGDSSYTAGYFATETITFKSHGSSSSKISFPNMSFGCGRNNAGLFSKHGSGMVGLGGGPLSLVSQFGPVIGGKFSYCLIPLSKEGNYKSKINFGDKAVVSGPGVITIPLIKGEPNTYYYLTLNGISVGQTTKRPFYEKSFTNTSYGNSQGNIIIDSGATLTILPLDMYNDLTTALDNTIQSEKIKDPRGQLTVCYRTTNGGADLGIPNVTLHFEGGDLVLKPSNIFVEVAKGVMCLAVLAPQDDLGPNLGNVAQMDFLVGYDTVQGKISFMPTDCTKA